MEPLRLVLGGAVLAAAFACTPDLPSSPEAVGPRDIVFELEPRGSDVAQAPPVVRIVVRPPAGVEIAPSEVAFVRGELTPHNLGQLGAGLPSEALAKRILTATTYVDGDELVIVPHAPLEPAERYSVGIGALEAKFELLASASPPEVLSRAWPVAPSGAALFYCGTAPLESLETRASLEPLGIEGWFRRGSPGGHALACLRFEPLSDAPSVTGIAFPPPVVGDSFLDPSPIEVTEERARAVVIECGQGEVEWGPGCAATEDDRVVVRGPDAPVLWIVAPERGVEAVSLTEKGSRFAVVGLEPLSTIAVHVETLEGDGVWRSFATTLHTKEPRGRPVLNEVYANAIGPEPAQEWIELVNGGRAALDLAGLAIEDAGGSTVLPDGAGVLSPGAFALVVNDDFDPEAGFDVAPAASALVVRVPRLGSNGLSNAGEPLRLLDAGGVERSAFPATPKGDAGASVARRSPDTLDEDPDGFLIANPPTPGSHN